MRAVLRLAAVFVLSFVLAAGAPAQAETLADVRAQLNVLNGQVHELRAELVRQGAAGGLPSSPATALVRLDQLEAELRRLTNQVDVLVNDVDRIVKDATNRVGDIEFRLVELEGGDVALLGKPDALGGGVTTIVPKPRPEPRGGDAAEAQLTVTEKSDFDLAVEAAEAGDNARAAQLFQTFLRTYPGGPLSGEVQFRLGDAQSAQSDWSGAARSYLDAFSGAPDGPLAPRALYRLAVSLGELGKVGEACLTLVEVDSRYPGSEVAGDVVAQKRTLNCQ